MLSSALYMYVHTCTYVYIQIHESNLNVKIMKILYGIEDLIGCEEAEFKTVGYVTYTSNSALLKLRMEDHRLVAGLGYPDFLGHPELYTIHISEQLHSPQRNLSMFRSALSACLPCDPGPSSGAVL